MSNEDQIIELLLAMRSDIAELKSSQERLEKQQDNLNQHLVTLENELIPKVTALFDGFDLRGDQLESLKSHFDERLDDFQEDVVYLISKTAKQEKQIVSVSKRVKQILP